jgi:hypothetical protein
VSVAEDCLSPERTFHGCPLIQLRGSIRGSFSVVLAFACPAVGKFSRASSAGGRLNLRSNIKHPDCVGRRGLSEPREDFSRLPTLANQILARTFFRSVALQFACPAVGKFSRASSAGGRLNLRSSIKQPDRVGRRGLSEPREDFSRLPTLANQILARTFFRSVALQFACPAVGKFSRASSAGGRLNLRSSIKQPDRVGRRGLSEPREDFSRLPHLCNP